MSRIDIVVAQLADPSQTLAILRQAEPETSIAEFQRRIAARIPAVEYVLFENDHVEVAAKLGMLVREIPASGAAMQIFELPGDVQFEAHDQSRREIPSSTLENILGSAEGEFE